MGRNAFVRETLKSHKLSYEWLRLELVKQGINVRPADLSALFGNKAEAILEASCDIVADYVKRNG